MFIKSKETRNVELLEVTKRIECKESCT